MKYYNSKLFALTGLVSLGLTVPKYLFSAEKDKTSLPNIIIIYRDDRLQAVRSGKWKLHVYRPETGATRILYDLEADIGETTDVAGQNPEIVKRLEDFAESARKDMGDAATEREGVNVRPVGEL